MQKESIKFESSTVLEGMTSIRALLAAKKAGINDRPIMKIVYDKNRSKKLEKELRYLGKMAIEYGFSLEGTDADAIDEITLGNSHGGILAICGERNLPKLKSCIFDIKPGFYVMVQGIEDPYNFGYALRSLYACGADGVILCGCHPGDCHYTSGNYFTRRRMAALFSMLDFLGIEKERTRVEWVSAAEGAKFAATMNDFVQTVTALGENKRLEDLRCKK